MSLDNQNKTTSGINSILGNILKKSNSVFLHNFRVKLLLTILFFSGASTIFIQAKSLHNKELQTDIAQEIIRFHVIANSDSNEDQELKIKVKEALVKSLSPLLNQTSSVEEARTILSENLSSIEKLAGHIVGQNGYSYPVKVTLEDTYFPLKIYGDYTFPPGYYEALRVQIGKAEGKNWWCVMFPPLCFVDETYSVVDEASGDKLKNILTEEEYNTLINKKTPIKIRFKLFESIRNFFKA